MLRNELLRVPNRYSNINMRTHHVGAPQWTGGASILAEIGSVQVTAVTAGLIHR